MIEGFYQIASKLSVGTLKIIKVYASIRGEFLGYKVTMKFWNRLKQPIVKDDLTKDEAIELFDELHEKYFEVR